MKVKGVGVSNTGFVCGPSGSVFGSHHSPVGILISSGTPGPAGPAGPPGPAGESLSAEQLQQIADLVAGGGNLGGGVGVPGPPGEDGKPGTQWFFGEGAPALVVGSRPGDAYLDVLSGQIYTLGD